MGSMHPRVRLICCCMKIRHRFLWNTQRLKASFSSEKCSLLRKTLPLASIAYLDLIALDSIYMESVSSKSCKKSDSLFMGHLLGLKRLD